MSNSGDNPKRSKKKNKTSKKKTWMEELSDGEDMIMVNKEEKPDAKKGFIC